MLLEKPKLQNQWRFPANSHPRTAGFHEETQAEPRPEAHSELPSRRLPAVRTTGDKWMLTELICSEGERGSSEKVMAAWRGWSGDRRLDRGEALLGDGPARSHCHPPVSGRSPPDTRLSSPPVQGAAVSARQGGSGDRVPATALQQPGGSALHKHPLQPAPAPGGQTGKYTRKKEHLGHTDRV